MELLVLYGHYNEVVLLLNVTWFCGHHATGPVIWYGFNESCFMANRPPTITITGFLQGYVFFCMVSTHFTCHASAIKKQLTNVKHFLKIKIWE